MFVAQKGLRLSATDRMRLKILKYDLTRCFLVFSLDSMSVRQIWNNTSLILNVSFTALKYLPHCSMCQIAN